jgi:hypothetical protein
VSHAYIDSEAALRGLPRAEAEARKQSNRIPNLADAYFALARVIRLRDGLSRPMISFESARPRSIHPDALDLYMLHLSNVGRLKEALAIAEKLRALEPYVPGFTADIGQILGKRPHRCRHRTR